jgi:hypothetical protein
MGRSDASWNGCRYGYEETGMNKGRSNSSSRSKRSTRQKIILMQLVMAFAFLHPPPRRGGGKRWGLERLERLERFEPTG